MLHIFVYGTLKEGMKNHHILENMKATKICEAQTTKKYPMFDLGNGFPYVQNKKGIGHIIHGEIWVIDSEFEIDLDRFEGVPELYKKGKIDASFDTMVYEDLNCYFIADELDRGELEQVDLFDNWQEDSFDIDAYFKKMLKE